jgi:phosphoribosylamine-glycine ligase
MPTNKDMGFLIVSEGGDGLGLAIRLKAEGHQVSMSIKDPSAEQRGEGLIEKNSKPDFTPLLLADCTGSGALLDAYVASGGLSFGGSQIADKLECDRKYASSIFKQAGIKEPFSKEFTDWDSAFQFIQDWDEDSKLVFKPEGKFSGVVPSYVPHDNEELIEMLEHYKGIIGNETEFILQEFIEGACISSECWVSKGRMLSPTNHTLERKQLMPGDLGPSGGCTGNVVWGCEGNCPLCESLSKLKGFLEECQYNGAIDINTVVSKEGDIYALEFTPRFGYDAFPTFLYGLFEGDFGAFVNDCCRGESPELPLKNGFAAGIRISCPPWPSEEFHARGGEPIRGLSKSNLDRFYAYEINLQEDSFVTSGGYGIIGVAIGYSEEGIEEAFEEAYKVCRKIKIPNAQYRIDLAETFGKEYRQIQRSLEVSV